jgi:hypothetical protein
MVAGSAQQGEAKVVVDPPTPAGHKFVPYVLTLLSYPGCEQKAREVRARKQKDIQIQHSSYRKTSRQRAKARLFIPEEKSKTHNEVFFTNTSTTVIIKTRTGNPTPEAALPLTGGN